MYFNDFHKAPLKVSDRNLRTQVLQSLGSSKFIQSLLMARRYIKIPKPLYVTAEKITKTAIRWLMENLQYDFFLWIHYMDLHELYLILNTKAGRLYSKDLTTFKQVRLLKPKIKYTGDIIDVYDDKLGIDLNIKMLFNFLENKRILDNTLVIITSDHRQEFYDRGNSVT